MKSPTIERFNSIEELDSESKYLVHKAKDATQNVVCTLFKI